MFDENPPPTSSSNGNPTPTPLLEQLMNNFLYLHPSENPAVSLVSPVLDSTNYHLCQEQGGIHTWLTPMPTKG